MSWIDQMDQHIREAERALGVACWHLAPILERETARMNAGWAEACAIAAPLFERAISDINFTASA